MVKTFHDSTSFSIFYLIIFPYNQPHGPYESFLAPVKESLQTWCLKQNQKSFPVLLLWDAATCPRRREEGGEVEGQIFSNMSDSLINIPAWDSFGSSVNRWTQADRRLTIQINAWEDGGGGGVLTVSFIAADNETGERRGWTCEFPPLVSFQSLPPTFWPNKETKKVCISEKWKSLKQRKHDGRCVGGRNRDRTSLAVVVWSCFLGKGTVLFCVFTPPPPKKLVVVVVGGKKILWKHQLLFPFRQTKAKDPQEADMPVRGGCKMKRGQRNQSAPL